VPYFYRDLTPAEADAKVSPAVRAAAARAVPILGKELRLAALAFTWFEPAPGEPKAWDIDIQVKGVCYGTRTTVKILAMDSEEEVIRCIAHEAFHRHQHEHLGLPAARALESRETHVWAETGADRYEEDFWRRFSGKDTTFKKYRNFGGRELDQQLKADMAALESVLR
jgi:hypothetical protein